MTHGTVRQAVRPSRARARRSRQRLGRAPPLARSTRGCSRGSGQADPVRRGQCRPGRSRGDGELLRCLAPPRVATRALVRHGSYAPSSASPGHQRDWHRSLASRLSEDGREDAGRGSDSRRRPYSCASSTVNRGLAIQTDLFQRLLKPAADFVNGGVTGGSRCHGLQARSQCAACWPGLPIESWFDQRMGRANPCSSESRSTASATFSSA